MKKKKRPPAALFAMGREDLPREVEAMGVRWRFVKLFKHDFFAATGLYESQNGSDPALRGEGEGRMAVLKVQRTYPLWGLPMKWLGKKVANHEIRIYEKLQGVRGIPTFLGRVGPTGFLHEFIPGVDLHAKLPLTSEFFAELETLFRELHERHVAYVDSNKRENILYGDDGKPWLIDFQISFECKRGERDNFLAKAILRKFVKADWYHYYKHKTRLLPGVCTEDDFERAKRRGFLHQLHRLVARPIIRVRRMFLSRYDLDKTK
ncbi:MAG: hypothetical protein FWD53_11035 [Phycisphaerales bacterium]|nr:hypothetical protein [Phycisphaerales bacterium]